MESKEEKSVIDYPGEPPSTINDKVYCTLDVHDQAEQKTIFEPNLTTHGSHCNCHNLCSIYEQNNHLKLAKTSPILKRVHIGHEANAKE